MVDVYWEHNPPQRLRCQRKCCFKNHLASPSVGLGRLETCIRSGLWSLSIASFPGLPAESGHWSLRQSAEAGGKFDRLRRWHGIHSFSGCTQGTVSDILSSDLWKCCISISQHFSLRSSSRLRETNVTCQVNVLHELGLNPGSREKTKTCYKGRYWDNSEIRMNVSHF